MSDRTEARTPEERRQSCVLCRGSRVVWRKVAVGHAEQRPMPCPMCRPELYDRDQPSPFRAAISSASVLSDSDGCT
jgi:hypothetical protein